MWNTLLILISGYTNEEKTNDERTTNNKKKEFSNEQNRHKND
jgi:hypothetical protein